MTEPMLLREAAGLMLGAIAGSLLATLLIRWPKGEGIGGRSHCDGCGAPLQVRDLVPILSYAAARGRCRRCGAAIDRRHLAVELGAALIGLVAVLAHPLPLAAISALLGWSLLLIALLDAEHHWLPDGLTLPLIPLGLAAAWAGFGPPLAERAAGAAIGWAVLFLIAGAYRVLRGREGMGDGDPKLFAAIGAWIGVWLLPFILLGAGLLGLAAVALMRLRGEPVTGETRLPLGTLMGVAAWPIWLIAAGSFSFGP